MKSYTDVEQPKKLAEILPLESADMYYSATMYGERQEIIWTSWEVNLDFDARIRDRHEYAVPCWSLAVLLDALPVLDNRSPVIPKTFDGKYRVVYHSTACERGIFTHDYGNPVDACVEMIIRLHELKML